MTNSAQNPQTVTIDTLKKLVGVIAMFFPLMLILLSYASGQCTTVQETISHYYYSIVGNVFVGALSSIAIFMIIYKGYPNSNDNIATNVAGIGALGIAFFPTSAPCDTSTCIVVNLYDVPNVASIHYGSAVVMFVALAYICIFLFRKHGGSPTPKKLARNKIYLVCGITILLAIISIAVLNLFGLVSAEWLCETKIVLVLEWVALFAFGLSWMIKGGFFLKD